MSKTTIVHVNDPSGYDVYIGRAMPRKGLKASPFANPFKIGEHGDRAEVLRFFFEYFHERLRDDKAFWNAAKTLRGKRLACWCAPKGVVLTVEDDHICHGQIIAEWLG